MINKNDEKNMENMENMENIKNDKDDKNKSDDKANNKKNDIFFRIRKIIAEVLNFEEKKITINSKIVDDLGAESLDIVTLLMEFEDEFKKQIPDEDAAKLITVGDAVNYIYSKMS